MTSEPSSTSAQDVIHVKRPGHERTECGHSPAGLAYARDAAGAVLQTLLSESDDARDRPLSVCPACVAEHGQRTRA